MALLNKAAILEADDLPCREVDVPEWGGSVRVRTLSAMEREVFDQSLSGGDGQPNLTNIRGRLLSMCLVDESGARMFSDAEAESLGKKSTQAVQRLFLVAQQLNGLHAAAVEDAEKN